jgi:hypothetical protein
MLFSVSRIETTGIGAVQFNRKRWERAFRVPGLSSDGKKNTEKLSSTLSILILKSNRQTELCFQRLGNM